MFEVLLAADAKSGSAHARGYYTNAVEIAFAVAAIDLHTSEHELAAIERFRGMLLGAIEAMEGTRQPVAGGHHGRRRGHREGRRRRPRTRRPVRSTSCSPSSTRWWGSTGVKHEVKLVTNLLRVQRIREERGLPTMDQSRHLIFTGNPGTGKTTVARLLAQIYRTLGVVERGHLVETDRAGLVAGYVGQTAPLVLARFDEADQGVLLIDEAYSLVRGGERDFGREAIDAIVKLIEDRRDRIVVVMAGYPDEMEELISSNPGLRSRFPKVIHFPDYTTDELLAIIGLDGRQGRLPARSRRPRPGADLARLDHARQGLRQRPHRPQPVRARGVHAGHPPRARSTPPPTSSSPSSSPTTSPSPARGRSRSCDRSVRSDRAEGAGGPRGGGHGRRRRDAARGHGRRRRWRTATATATTGRRGVRHRPRRRVRRARLVGGGADARIPPSPPPRSPTAPSPTTSTRGSPPRPGWRWRRAARPSALGDARAIATSPAVVATAPGRYEAISDLCAGDDIWQCLGGSAGYRLGDAGRRLARRAGAS